jgi:DNA-directed RNA polymerase specialized sigma24 family protein
MLTEDRRNEPGPSKANERLELVAIARRELAALSDRQREVMELMCIERLAAGEVAKRMGSTVKAVYRLVEKGRRRMLSRLAACGMRSGETTGKKHDCPACALRMWCTKWLLLNEF